MIDFVKMHGIGNDYVYIERLNGDIPADIPELARRMSDRNFGIGGDGIVLIVPSELKDAHCRMRMFNPDGSEAEMCGNAIRCVAKLVHDDGCISENPLRIETGAGLLVLELNVEDGLVRSVRVDMGPPRFSPAEIGMTLKDSRALDMPLSVDRREFKINCVSMGNPHAVIFIDEPVDDFAVEHYGPLIENDPLFTNRTNVEFVNVLGPQLLRQRTWERGAGETLACGTGASAVGVAAVLTGRVKPGEMTIRLNGGELKIEWTESGNVFKTGPAEEVFRGSWPE
jgi:diaminopimelate epimerase